MTSTEEAAYRRLASRYPDDPCGYARDVLGATLTPAHEELARLIRTPPYRVLLPSANKVGKTWGLSWLLNWHHDQFDPGVVLATAPTARTLTTQLFKEVRASRPFGLGLMPAANEIKHHPKHFVLGFTARNEDSFKGQHEGRAFFAFDEMTGVPGNQIDAFETMWGGTPDHMAVGAYNPHDTTAPPYALEQGGGWHLLRFSALDHPNILAQLRGEPPPFPNAIRLKRVRERIAKECADCGTDRVAAGPKGFEFPKGSGRWYRPLTPAFEVHILGLWPTQSMQAIWSPDDLRACRTPLVVDPRWPVQIGCDPARGGGDAVANVVRKGYCVVHLERMPLRTKSPAIADRLRELCVKYAPEGVSPRSIPCLIDDTGGYGSGVVDYPEGFNFHGVVASRRALDEERYPNVRSELWWRTKLAADQGAYATGNIQEGRHLLVELEQEDAAARYLHDGRQRWVVTGKDEVRSRLKRSPDLADGRNLAYYPVPGLSL